MKSPKITWGILLFILTLLIVTNFRSSFTSACEPPSGGVHPPFIETTIPSGGSIQITKTVSIPEYPPMLDLFLIVDLSGSYTDDLPKIRDLAPSLFDEVQAHSPDARLGLGSFVDFPFLTWGNNLSGDYAYRLEQGLTSDKSIWLSAINAMEIHSGASSRESQYEALYQAATGAGREIPLTVDADFNDRGEISPNQDADFRPDALKIIVLTTDAPFHTMREEVCKEVEAGCPFPYPGALRDETVVALQTAGIRVIGIKGLIRPDGTVPGLDEAMDDLAQATDGAVKTTDTSSSELIEAILNGLEELKFDVTATPVGCDPLEITFDPPMYENIQGGETVQFIETISVPQNATEGLIQCSVVFKAGSNIIGTQKIKIKIKQLKPTDIGLVSFTAEVELDNTAVINWETITETDNAGFNLYRATSVGGPWYRVNNVLIPAIGDSASGGNYTFRDTPGYGVFYYHLEDVDSWGIPTLHDPSIEIKLNDEIQSDRFNVFIPIVVK